MLYEVITREQTPAAGAKGDRSAAHGPGGAVAEGQRLPAASGCRQSAAERHRFQPARGGDRAEHPGGSRDALPVGRRSGAGDSRLRQGAGVREVLVITSYSIHYTKLYEMKCNGEEPRLFP